MSEIKKGWSKGYFDAPDSIFDKKQLSVNAKIVYLYLCRCADSEYKAFPGYSNIAEKTSISKKSVQRAIDELVSYDLIVKEVRYDETRKRYYSNKYTLNHPDQMKDEPMVTETIPIVTQTTPMVTETIPIVTQTTPMVTETTEGQHTKDYTLRTTYKGQQQHNEEPTVSPLNLGDDPVEKQQQSQTQNNVVVDDKIFKLFLKYGMPVNMDTIKYWRTLADEKTILEVCEDAIKRRDIRNTGGYITTTLRQYNKSTPSIGNEKTEVVKSEINNSVYQQTRKDKYSVFYDLYKKGESDQRKSGGFEYELLDGSY